MQLHIILMHIVFLLTLIDTAATGTLMYLPAFRGMAMGTQESPRPVAGEDSNVFARKAEMG